MNTQKWISGVARRLYTRNARYLEESRVFGKLVDLQHRFAPLPLAVFDRLFRVRPIARLLAPYGLHVFLSRYKKRLNNESYWLSRESLYWHLYRQNDVQDESLRGIAAEPRLRERMTNGELTFLEPGFGLGKQTRAMMAAGLLSFRTLYACDLNPHVRAYVKKRFGPTFTLLDATIRDLSTTAPQFDVLLANGGVFMYTEAQELDQFFGTLKSRGCNTVIILQEGSPSGDVRRPDNTTIYDFKSRLERLYLGAQFVESVGPLGIYDYFAMLA
jgi:hypothetical protein